MKKKVIKRILKQLFIVLGMNLGIGLIIPFILYSFSKGMGFEVTKLLMKTWMLLVFPLMMIFTFYKVFKYKGEWNYEVE